MKNAAQERSKNARTATRLHIGTSGWHYDHWIGPFYPSGLPKKSLLNFYIRHFQTVEINNSFYNLPQEKTLAGWRDTVPDGFIFAVKASRYITHMKKLNQPEQSLATFLNRIKVLEDKLGPILFQLPPRWKFNPQRLDAFLAALPENHRYSFEFRDTSWFNDQTYQSLARHNAAFCIYHLSGLLSPKKVTADFAYVRLHGPKGAYQGRYSREVLQSWAQILKTWLSQGKQIYCYFDNDEAGFAVNDALGLQQMIM